MLTKILNLQEDYFRPIITGALLLLIFSANSASPLPILDHGPAFPPIPTQQIQATRQTQVTRRTQAIQQIQDIRIRKRITPRSEDIFHPVMEQDLTGTFQECMELKSEECQLVKIYNFLSFGQQKHRQSIKP